MRNYFIFLFFFFSFSSFSQNLIIVGPNNDCNKGIGKKYGYTYSQYFDISGYEKLKITTFQHRTFDHSKIFDAVSGKLLWEWRGESKDATWYTKEHFVEFNLTRIRVEFTQGYSDPFCNGFVKVEKMSSNNFNNASNSQNIKQEKSTSNYDNNSQVNTPRDSEISQKEKVVISQKVSCMWCGGDGTVQEWIDPRECQNCVNWNSSYRNKVPCHICKDTRITPNRRSKSVPCSSCNGSGRNYAQEKRNIEFGGSDFMLSSTSIVTVYGLKVHVGSWMSRTGPKDAWMTYAEAEGLCQSLGNGWRIPTRNELDLLLNAQKSNQYQLGFKVDNGYWSSTSEDGTFYRICGSPSTLILKKEKGSASCKCVNSN